MFTRRAFLAASSARILLQALPAAPTTRPNIASIDRLRILSAATNALTQLPKPTRDPQSDAFLAFTLNVPALAAASLIDPPNAIRYTTHAAAHLDAWFLNPSTRLPPTPVYAAFQPIADLASLAEIAVALPFFALEATLYAELQQWFADFLTWLTSNRNALLARDAKDYIGAAWLLLASASARLTTNDTTLADLRHRYRTVSIRAQLNSNGFFPADLPTPNPFRNSLNHLDLLAGTCQLLSTRFESLWDVELQDGPGMRAAIARFSPYIANRERWPYPADTTHFNLLPCRRPALVFAARAFQQADYATLWGKLNADPADPDILRAFPIRQPILWLTQPKPPQL